MPVGMRTSLVRTLCRRQAPPAAGSCALRLVVVALPFHSRSAGWSAALVTCSAMRNKKTSCLSLAALAAAAAAVIARLKRLRNVDEDEIDGLVDSPLADDDD